MRFLIIIFSVFLYTNAFSQLHENKSAKIWADSVYNSLNNDERIALVEVRRDTELQIKINYLFLNNYCLVWIAK
jgi:hypothetical protein